MRAKCSIGAVAVAVLLVTTTTATGGLLESGVFGVPGGVPPWNGLQQFRSFMNVLAVDVEHCVYPSGAAFGQALQTIGLTDPTGGTSNLVYAYQIFNDLDPHPNQQVQGSLAYFSVYLDEDEQAAGISYVPASGVAPDSSAFAQNIAGWNFSPTLNYTEVSAILYFTSPMNPEWSSGGVSGSGLGDNQDVPAPSSTPEPSSLVIFVTMGLLAVRARRTK